MYIITVPTCLSTFCIVIASMYLYIFLFCYLSIFSNRQLFAFNVNTSSNGFFNKVYLSYICVLNSFSTKSTTCGQAQHVDKYNMWTSTTCGQAQHVEKHNMWTSTTCGQAQHVDKYNMWTSTTCRQAQHVD